MERSAGDIYSYMAYVSKNAMPHRTNIINCATINKDKQVSFTVGWYLITETIFTDILTSMRNTINRNRTIVKQINNTE